MQFQCIKYHFYILKALLVETLNEDEQKRPEQEMEITFEPGLQETAEQLVQRKLGEFHFTVKWAQHCLHIAS